MSADVEVLRRELGGQVHSPGTPPYTRATSPLNATADQHPFAVVSAGTADDVATCVRLAAEAGLRVAAQATGHGAAGTLGEDVVLLDTSRLSGVEVDPHRRIVRAGAGATFADINEAAFAHGLLAAGGTAPDVAVAGYTAYGGVGWLTRPHGLACASLLGVDFVDGGGRCLRADDEQHPDVLWAYRGGGGVGVATHLELRLFPATELWAGYVLWPVSHAATVLTAWGQALPRLHAALSSAISVLHAPDAPTVPESLRGQVVVHLSAATVAGRPAMQTLRDVLDTLPAAELDTLGPCDAARLSTIHLDPPAAVPALGVGRWLTAGAGDHAFDILTAAGVRPDAPLAEVELRHVAAPTATVPGALTSCPGDILLHATGAAPDPTSRRTTAQALDTVLAAAASASVDTGRSAAAFQDGQTSAPRALEPVAVRRLAEIRAAVDPAGLIVTARPLDAEE